MDGLTSAAHIASKDCIYGHQLLYQASSSMATTAQGTQAVRPNIAQRCNNTMELHLQYASVFT